MNDIYEQSIIDSGKLLQSIIAIDKRSSSKVDVEYIGGGTRGQCCNNAEDYIRDYRQNLKANEETRAHYWSLTNQYIVQGGWLIFNQ